MFVVAFPIALGIAGCGSGSAIGNLIHSEHVDKASFHGTWPITSDAGTLACDATKGGSITFSPDDSSDTYAVNGTAMGWAPKEGWKDFHEIWLVNTSDDAAGPNVHSSDFDAEGQKLGWICPRSYFFAAVFLAGGSFAVLLAGACLAGVPLPRFTCGRTMRWTAVPTARSAL